VAGRPWTVAYASEPALEALSSTSLAAGVLLTGLLASAWIFWLAIAQARARRAAERANRTKSDFLATMSHELRTPLNAIGGYVDLLDLGVGGVVNAQQREYLARVQRAQQHLLGLINNILNFARLEAGGVSFQRERLALTPLIAEAETFVTPLVADKQLAFSIEPGPDLIVLGDAEKIRQILLNLLSNAVKFTDCGGRIAVRWESNGRSALVHVDDTGIGIPILQQERIFDPFVQVDPDLTRTRMGSGLGLAISRELARGMAGDLTVRSAPGWGSTFTLQLPLREPAAGPASPIPT
jgi:signal transduction histidine kinase